MQDRFALTAVEARIDALANRLLAHAPARGPRARLVEFLVFGAKQAWACVFGAAFLAVVLAAKLWYPDDALVARNDALTIAAVLIQAVMLAGRLETVRELRVVLLFHIVGTAMELFKTDVGSWSYPADGVLRIAAVPLYSGFMYAAVGSYMVRVQRLFDLRFTRYPRRRLTAVVAVLIYVNFFSHHWIADLRWPLLGAVVVLWARTTMHFRFFRGRFRMPLLAAFAGVALFIWLAENVATYGGAWLYPSQLDGWHPVDASKLVSWFLLMIVSVVLVTWVHPPRQPDPVAGDGDTRTEGSR
jgi:uncharacterized membrane protein YoaT (DUF817 family)